MRLPVRLLVLGILLAACQASPSRVEGDWTIGTWRGVRRDARDGTESPMTMRVEALPGGRGQLRLLTVGGEAGTGAEPYRGVAVVMPDESLGRWAWVYGNSSERPFARYLGPPWRGGVALDAHCEWRSASPGRSRESRLVSERLADGSWRRTMYVAPLGQEHEWTELWCDLLQPSSRGQRPDETASVPGKSAVRRASWE